MSCLSNGEALSTMAEVELLQYLTVLTVPFMPSMKHLINQKWPVNAKNQLRNLSSNEFSLLIYNFEVLCCTYLSVLTFCQLQKIC